MTSLKVPKGRELSPSSNEHEDDNDFSNESAIDNAAAVGAVLPAVQKADYLICGILLHGKNPLLGREFPTLPSSAASVMLPWLFSKRALSEAAPDHPPCVLEPQLLHLLTMPNPSPGLFCTLPCIKHWRCTHAALCQYYI